MLVLSDYAGSLHALVAANIAAEKNAKIAVEQRESAEAAFKNGKTSNFANAVSGGMNAVMAERKARDEVAATV